MTEFAPKLAELSERDLAYFAGIVDGEGCIYIAHKFRREIDTYWSCLSVGNTNGGLIQWILAKFGGHSHVRRRGRYREFHQWGVYCGYARDVLAAVEPYLLMKREQARIAIELHAAMRITDLTLRQEKCAPLKATMHILNGSVHKSEAK